MSVKDIKVEDLITIEDCDYAEEEILTALAKMKNSLDYTSQSGTVKLNELDEDTRLWFLRTKAAMRFAKVTLRGVVALRTSLQQMAEVVEEELVKLTSQTHVDNLKEAERQRLVEEYEE